ncbi:MAG: hypothetical protein ALECFALPRED_010083 [Alectoria fallacina]|uniref:Uncharacterized protein n=1 Tax=Alectoria fallacina TaxID=1903189 RepID=A0A8H3PJD6_9LECA|nr:MAG: hypothetical protein ALECFALPRED_010083 [Alectoria fallacina]
MLARELHSDTLAALKDFYSDRELKEKRFQDLKSDIEQNSSQVQLSMDMFSEDWNTSQFWYSDETANILAKQLLPGSTAATTNICIASGKYQASSICLLEFDNRFDVFREFIHYDFEHPLALPGDMKAAMTVRWLSKSASPNAEKSSSRIIVCTGERMEELVLKLYPGIMTTNYDPQHAQNRLGNDFSLRHRASKFDRVDVLINDAGVPKGASPEDLTTRQRYAQIMDTSTISAACLTETFISPLRKAPQPHIIFMTLGLGSIGDTLNLVFQYYDFDALEYKASKTALNMIMATKAVKFKEEDS